ncbi:MAG: hypothetical protein WC457_02320 [Patescibacteria group bacterium]
MKNVFNIVKFLVTLAANVVVTMTEIAFWLLSGLRFVFKLIVGLWGARSAIRGGVVTCPRGHVFSLVGQVYECTSCGYTYENSSILKCENPECRAPIAPYVNCPVCGLSVLNPFRIHI